MRLMVLTVMGLIGGLGLAAAIVSVPVMAEKGPLRTTLVAHLGGGQEEELPGGGDPDGKGRAVVNVFKEQLCGRVETGAIESSSTKATINLGMSGEQGPTVANLEERAATTSLPESTTPTTTTTTTTGTATPTTGSITATTGTTGTTTGTTGTTTGTTTATTGAMGAQQTGTTTTTTGGTTSPQATTTAQSTTVGQTSLSQSTASPTASASASASATASASASAASTSRASTSTSTIHEHTGGCVEVPRALSLELLEHPRRFYVNVTNEQHPEGAIRGQLHRSSDDDHRNDNDDD